MNNDLGIREHVPAGMALRGPIVVCHLPSADASGSPKALARWRRHVLANAAPRERSYMEALLKRHFPACEALQISDKGLPQRDLSEFSSIVLLFPDPIGLGFSRIERKLSEHIAGKRLFALNGRGRLLLLNRPTLRRLRLRRFLAWTRIPEFLFLAVFLALTPVLAGMDLLRGRR